jgi:hypothetical protein
VAPLVRFARQLVVRLAATVTVVTAVGTAWALLEAHPVWHAVRVACFIGAFALGALSLGALRTPGSSVGQLGGWYVGPVADVDFTDGRPARQVDRDRQIVRAGWDFLLGLALVGIGLLVGVLR